MWSPPSSTLISKLELEEGRGGGGKKGEKGRGRERERNREKEKGERKCTLPVWFYDIIFLLHL
jgi:hypothetical protein